MTCKTCKFWKRTRSLTGETDYYGACECPKFVDCGPPPIDGLVFWDRAGEADCLIETGEDFGCIHHETGALAVVRPLKDETVQ